jgi:hypothetical protein
MLPKIPPNIPVSIIVIHDEKGNVLEIRDHLPISMCNTLDLRRFDVKINRDNLRSMVNPYV